MLSVNLYYKHVVSAQNYSNKAKGKVNFHHILSKDYKFINKYEEMQINVKKGNFPPRDTDMIFICLELLFYLYSYDCSTN